MKKLYTTSELIQNAIKRAKGIPVILNLDRYFQFAAEAAHFDYTKLSLPQLAARMDELTRGGICRKSDYPGIFALISEAAYRHLEIRAFPEQLAAGKILLDGGLAQMQTGEGKTLAAVFAAVVQVKLGRSLHIFTANDYLAGRDCRWMGEIYRSFGINAASVDESMTDDEKRKNYRADIVYLTAKQAGFDYLRDCLEYRPDKKFIPLFDLCIVDEADFILIDEARTPLVIARARSENYIDSVKADLIASELDPDVDFTIDRRARRAVLSLEGIDKVCRKLGIDDSTIDGRIAISGVNVALHARHLLKLNVDYMVRNDQIELVDAHTGRKADRREWPYGIQRALEAKEGVSIRRDGEICGSVTIENFIRLYGGVSAMTATAEPAAGEFHRAYGLNTYIIPAHRPDCRIDLPDMVFKTVDAKLKKLLETVREANAVLQPVLIGTASIAESARVSGLLTEAGIKHQVLNARQDAQEAELIARAGCPGVVTVATNMAGRGTDIILGGPDGREAKRVIEAGGLFVIGLNRYESLRVDHQLRGRAGRQGDPGLSLFMMSLEDELFNKYGIKEFLPPEILAFDGNSPLQSRRAAREIARAQEIIEDQHSVMRRTLHRYSAVIEKFRLIIQELKSDAATEGLFPEEFLLLLDETGGELPSGSELARLFCVELDEMWAGFLAFTDYVKEGIHLRRFGKREPFFEFLAEANAAFEDGLVRSIRKTAQAAEERISLNETESEDRRSGSTWTYQIDDNPFPSFSLSLVGMDSAVGAAAGYILVLFAPLFLFKWLAGKFKKKD